MKDFSEKTPNPEIFYYFLLSAVPPPHLSAFILIYMLCRHLHSPSLVMTELSMLLSTSAVPTGLVQKSNAVRKSEEILWYGLAFSVFLITCCVLSFSISELRGNACCES